jgi:hypothetical protein
MLDMLDFTTIQFVVHPKGILVLLFQKQNSIFCHVFLFTIL